MKHPIKFRSFINYFSFFAMIFSLNITSMFIGPQVRQSQSSLLIEQEKQQEKKLAKDLGLGIFKVPMPQESLIWVQVKDGNEHQVEEWKINEMLALRALLELQRSSNSVDNPLQALMITSQQLELLSHAFDALLISPETFTEYCNNLVEESDIIKTNQGQPWYDQLKEPGRLRKLINAAQLVGAHDLSIELIKKFIPKKTISKIIPPKKIRSIALGNNTSASAISSDGSKVAIAFNDDKALLKDLKTNSEVPIEFYYHSIDPNQPQSWLPKQIPTLIPWISDIFDIQFSPDNQLVLCIGKRKTKDIATAIGYHIELCNIKEKERIQLSFKFQGAVVALSPDKKCLATAGQDDLKICNLQKESSQAYKSISFLHHIPGIYISRYSMLGLQHGVIDDKLLWSFDSKSVLFFVDNNLYSRLAIYNNDTEKLIYLDEDYWKKVEQRKRDKVFALGWGLDNTQCFSLSKNSFDVWDATSGKNIFRLTPNEYEITEFCPGSIALSKNGRFCFIDQACQNRIIAIDLQQMIPQEIFLKKEGYDENTKAVFSPDCLSLAVLDNTSISLYDSMTGAEKITFDVNVNYTSLSFNNTGDKLFLSNKNTIDIWNLTAPTDYSIQLKQKVQTAIDQKLNPNAGIMSNLKNRFSGWWNQ